MDSSVVYSPVAKVADVAPGTAIQVDVGETIVAVYNLDGKFYQYPSPPYFPMAVISMAAADYNRDGLLDVYLCTYRPAAPVGASPAGGVAQVEEGSFDWPDEFLSPERAREFRQRMADLGTATVSGSPQELARLQASEIEKYRAIAATAGIVPE